jgi:hypothetical protein
MGGALTGAVLAAALGYSTRARSADHIDAPAATASPTADITDVYSWMDGTNQVLVMNLGGISAPTAFSTTTQYVFHTNSTSAYGTAGTTPVNVIATFDSTGKIQLWVGTSEYVTGDASAETGLASADGKVKVFAGPRADSFFFNLDGFHHAEAIVETVAAADAATPLTFANDAGCPALSVGQGQALTEALSTETDGGTAPNNFAANNVLSIVVSVDATLLNAGGPITSVWASTNGS